MQLKKEIMQIVNPQTESRFQHMLGKKVTCMCKGEKCTGILDFAGVNDMLHNQFQVTLSRTPLWPVDRSTVQLYTEKSGK